MEYSEWISTARLRIYPFQLACHMYRPVPINNVLDLTCKLYKFKWPANLRGKVPFSVRPPPRGFSSDMTVAPVLGVSISPLTLKFRAAPANSNLNFTVGIYISRQFEYHLSRFGTNVRPLQFDIQHDGSHYFYQISQNTPETVTHNYLQDFIRTFIIDVSPITTIR